MTYTTVLIVEGPSDAQIVGELLKSQEARGVLVQAAGSKSSVESLARSFLATRPERVGLLLDAGTTSAGSIKEQRFFVAAPLSRVAARDRWEVFLCVPTLAAVEKRAIAAVGVARPRRRDILAALAAQDPFPEVMEFLRSDEVLVLTLKPPGSGHGRSASLEAARQQARWSASTWVLDVKRMRGSAVVDDQSQAFSNERDLDAALAALSLTPLQRKTLYENRALAVRSQQ